MDFTELPRTVLRLRHLTAVTGRHFHISSADVEDIKGIFFAISLLGSESCAYFYISETCQNLTCPEWDSVDISKCPHDLRSSKAALFTFFAAQEHTNIVLFEIEVYFSGLIALTTEIHKICGMANEGDQVYFSFGGNYYTSPAYLNESIKQSKSHFRLNVKRSYDFEALQNIVLSSDIMESQQACIYSQWKSMDMLQSYMANSLRSEEEREVVLTYLSLLEKRLRVSQSACDETNYKLKRMKRQRAVLDEKFTFVTEAVEDLTTQINALKPKVSGSKKRLSALNDVLNLRTARLVRELLDIFGGELLCAGTKDPVMVSAFNGLSSQKSSSTVFNPPPQPDSVTFNDLSTGVPGEFGVKLTDLTQQTVAVDPSEATTAAHVGLVTHVMRVLYTIFNLPLRYPLDLTGGFSRARVTDQLSPDLTDLDHSYPLYLGRNSLLPTYKHAISLLQRNIIAVRDMLGLSIPNEDQGISILFCALLQDYLLDRRNGVP